ncbi:hypothetical protein [Enorma phocaeensis]|uniref:hypothetical protein n=1 Tax=Enorma phocaeensis TaxID=1871019 RepID=UPI0011AEE711|nr:hypothetical protein [Enorma phocaeensis]
MMSHLMAYTLIGLAIGLLVVLPAWVIISLASNARRQAKWKSMSRHIINDARNGAANRTPTGTNGERHE